MVPDVWCGLQRAARLGSSSERFDVKRVIMIFEILSKSKNNVVFFQTEGSNVAHMLFKPRGYIVNLTKNDPKTLFIQLQFTTKVTFKFYF